MEPPYWMEMLRATRAPYRPRTVARMLAADLAGLLGGGGLAGADGPDGLIGDDAAAHLFGGDAVQGALDLQRHPVLGEPARAAPEISPTQIMGLMPALQDGQHLSVDKLIGLTEIPAALGMAADDVFHAQILRSMLAETSPV
jgi:hypothetical protein